MMIKSVKLTNFLSFGNNSEEIELRPLNILIGTNGSGKSNFLEVFDFLQNTPSNIAGFLRVGGHVSDWINKSPDNASSAVLDYVITNPLADHRHRELRYVISFTSANQQFEIIDEKILSKEPDAGQRNPYIYYDFDRGRPTLNIQGDETLRRLQREDIDISQSILAQKRDAIHYPEITMLAREFNKIKLYREWSFGRYTPMRLPQKADLPNKALEPDCNNLGLILNQIRKDFQSKARLLKELQMFYHGVEDYHIDIESNTVQIFFQEQGLRSPVPATRLSDGTLRYLCLLSILCHPTPPPLVCIEEPELGLHPDILPGLGKLMHEFSERCQLIVTTHSEAFVDSFTNDPEAILVAEKDNSSTHLTRLDKSKLQPWLEKYRLGNLWTRGDIGGNRW